MASRFAELGTASAEGHRAQAPFSSRKYTRLSRPCPPTPAHPSALEPQQRSPDAMPLSNSQQRSCRRGWRGERKDSHRVLARLNCAWAVAESRRRLSRMAIRLENERLEQFAKLPKCTLLVAHHFCRVGFSWERPACTCLLVAKIRLLNRGALFCERGAFALPQRRLNAIDSIRYPPHH